MMEILALIALVILGAIAVKLAISAIKRHREKKREENAYVEDVPEITYEPEETPPPVKGIDPYAPKSDLAKANEAAAKAREAAKTSTTTASGPTTPVNNTYYGKQPRIARQDDTAIGINDTSNAAFLALIASQQGQPTFAEGGNVNGEIVEEPLTPEQEEILQEKYDKLQDDIAHTPEDNTTPDPEAGDEGTVKDDGKWEPVIEEKYTPSESKFDYDSSDNASTYNSATDNGTDSGSSWSSSSSYDSGSSSSSSSSSYDSGSSSSYSSDSGSSSSSFD